MRSRGYAVTREDLLTKPMIGDIVKDACGLQLRDVDTSWASALSSVTSHPATCSLDPAPSTAGLSVLVLVLECAGASQSLEAVVRVGVGVGAGGGSLYGGEHGSAVPMPLGSVK